MAAFEAAEARGEGVAVVNGRIVENLHVVTARRLIARAAAITELEAVSMTLLVLGLILWTLVHVFKRVAPGARAAMDRAIGARPARGVIAALLLLSPGADGGGLPAGALRGGL